MCVHHCFQVTFTHFLKSVISVLWGCICSWLSMGVTIFPKLSIAKDWRRAGNKTSQSKLGNFTQMVQQDSIPVTKSIPDICQWKMNYFRGLFSVSLTRPPRVWKLVSCKELWHLGEKCSSKYCHVWDWIKRRSHKRFSPLVISLLLMLQRQLLQDTFMQ